MEIIQIMDGIKHHRNRKRFLSVKVFRSKQLGKINSPQQKHQIIQNVLNNEIMKQNPQVYELKDDLLQENLLKQENVLWKKFSEKINLFGGKLQKQKINIYIKIVQNIINQSNQNITELINSLTYTKQAIQRYYKQTHSLYQEIQQNKESNSIKKLRKIQIKQELSFFKEKVDILQTNIAEIIAEIHVLEKEVELKTQKLNKMKNERQQFLKKLLRDGYYGEDGMKWLIQHLIKINKVPSIEDMPTFLDDISKECLMKEVQNILMMKQKPELQLPSIKVDRSKQMHSNIELFSNKSRVKQFYEDAKRYVQQKIRKKDWSGSEILLSVQNKQKTFYRWKDQQKKRIKLAYKGQLGQRIFKVLFGLKAQFFD